MPFESKTLPHSSHTECIYKSSEGNPVDPAMMVWLRYPSPSSLTKWSRTLDRRLVSGTPQVSLDTAAQGLQNERDYSTFQHRLKVHNGFITDSPRADENWQYMLKGHGVFRQKKIQTRNSIFSSSETVNIKILVNWTLNINNYTQITLSKHLTPFRPSPKSGYYPTFKTDES